MKYIPKIKAKGKWYTSLTENKGGIHNQRKFKCGVEMLEYASVEFVNPYLSHICFTGSDYIGYEAIIKRFCRSLTERGVRYEYKAAFEISKLKGLHCHLMIVLEHRRGGPHMYTLIDPFSGPLAESVDYYWDGRSEPLAFHISDSKHSRRRFLEIRRNNYGDLNEGVEWLSYIYKADSKQGVGPTIYLSSRNRERKPDRDKTPLKTTGGAFNSASYHPIAVNLMPSL